MKTLGLKNINMLSKEQYEEIESPFSDELYAISGSGFGFPSNRYIDLELGASGTEYTAPANGWFYVSKKATAANQEFVFENKSSANFTVNQDSVSSGRTIRLTISVKKGDIIYSYYTLGGNTDYFRFIYAEGEE